MNLVYGLALHEFAVTQRTERPPGVWGVIGSNPVGDSDFFFLPRSWHADYFISTVEIWFVRGQKSLFRGRKIVGESQTDFLPVLFISQDVCVLFCLRRSPVHIVVEMEH